MAERKVRVRFAPSPTGPLHIGGVRTALYNYLFARQHGGTMILRIEDTDSNRFVPGAEDYINEALDWLGIGIDEGVRQGGSYGPYRQSERRDIYHTYVKQLLDSGKAYIAFDTPQELEQKRKQVKNFQYDATTRMTMRNSLEPARRAGESACRRRRELCGALQGGARPRCRGARLAAWRCDHQLVDSRRQGAL
jgi:glutamyl-tRNA synthetase